MKLRMVWLKIRVNNKRLEKGLNFTEQNENSASEAICCRTALRHPYEQRSETHDVVQLVTTLG